MPEIEHLPSSSAEVKNEWSCTSAPRHVIIAWTGTASRYLVEMSAACNESETYRALERILCRLMTLHAVAGSAQLICQTVCRSTATAFLYCGYRESATWRDALLVEMD